MSHQHEYERLTAALETVQDELVNAIEAFSPISSAHEGYAIIREELDELWEDIKAGRPRDARTEAIQLAAMSVRFLIDLYDHDGKPN